MKALRYILYCLVILGAGGLLAYQAFVTKNLETSNAVKCGIIIAGAVLGMVRPRKSRIVNKKAVYQKAYSEYIDGAFHNDPKLEKVFYNALHNYNRNNYSGAVSKLEMLRKECHNSSDLRAVSIFLGLCMDDMGMYPQAAEHYYNAVQMRPTASVASNLGLCYQRMGKMEDAERFYHHAIAIDPKYAIAYNNLSVLYFRRGEYDKALELAKQAIEIDQCFAQALSTAALCCGLLHDKDGYDWYYRLAISNGYDGRRIVATLNRMLTENPNEEDFDEE